MATTDFENIYHNIKDLIIRPVVSSGRQTSCIVSKHNQMNMSLYFKPILRLIRQIPHKYLLHHLKELKKYKDRIHNCSIPMCSCMQCVTISASNLRGLMSINISTNYDVRSAANNAIILLQLLVHLSIYMGYPSISKLMFIQSNLWKPLIFIFYPKIYGLKKKKNFVMFFFL